MGKGIYRYFITAAQIVDGLIVEAMIGTGAVTEAKIGSGAVTAGKLATKTCYLWIPVGYGTGALGVFEHFPARVMKNEDPGDHSYASFMLPPNWVSGGAIDPVSMSTTATNISGVTQVEWGGNGESVGGNNVTNNEWTQTGVVANAFKRITIGRVTPTGDFEHGDMFGLRVEFYACGATTKLLGFIFQYTGYV